MAEMSFWFGNAILDFGKSASNNAVMPHSWIVLIMLVNDARQLSGPVVRSWSAALKVLGLNRHMNIEVSLPLNTAQGSHSAAPMGRV